MFPMRVPEQFDCQVCEEVGAAARVEFSLSNIGSVQLPEKLIPVDGLMVHSLGVLGSLI